MVRKVGPEALARWCEIPSRFEVKGVIRVDEKDGVPALREEKIARPWIKDYGVEGDEAAEWRRRFDLSNWAFFQAFDGDRAVGGAAVAFRTLDVDMLEEREDLAVLWDLRVHPDWQGRGVGKLLFRTAADWARARGAIELKIETQDVNVTACRFYAAMGCRLGSHDQRYPEPYAGEIMFIWRLDLSSAVIRLETGRLVIRELAEGDIPALHAIFYDPEVTRYMEYIKSGSLEQTTKWVRDTMVHNNARPRFSYNFIVLEKSGNAVIGWIGFGDPDEGKRHVGQRDFGYALGQAHWNKGYGAECLTAVLRYAFDELGTESFFGECDKRNPASARVMEKCGFTRIADLTEDSFCYRIMRADWERRRS